MLDEKWDRHISDLAKKVRRIADLKLKAVNVVLENIARTNSLSDHELSMVLERSKDYVKYTRTNMERVQRDPVYQKIKRLRIPAMERTTGDSYILVERASDKLIDSLHLRKMPEKYYNFLLERSDEEVIITLLCYFGINAAYTPNTIEDAA